MPDYISKITTSQGTFYLKDSEARDLIAAISGQIQFHVATNAATTPKDVTWDNNGTLVTGTLAPATNTGTSSAPVWIPTTGYYLVRATNPTGQDYYEEWVVVQKSAGGGTSYGGYAWEKLGDTEIDFSSLGALAYKDSVTLNKQTDKVLGVGTTFTPTGGNVSFAGGTTDTFVKSYPGATQKLQTTSITGTNGTVSVSQVTKSDVVATNTVFGTDTTASKVTKVAKTATNTVLGTATTASKATLASTPLLAQPTGTPTYASSVVHNSGINTLLETATVDTSTETLSFGVCTTAQVSFFPCKTKDVGGGVQGPDTVGVNNYTMTDVSVPVISSNSTVNFDAVSAITDVTVPVVSSNDPVTANAVSITNVNAAKAASSATVVATGSTTSTDSNGASVLTGLGTATTATAIKTLGAGTVTGMVVQVGTNDQVDALTDATSVTVS